MQSLTPGGGKYCADYLGVMAFDTSWLLQALAWCLPLVLTHLMLMLPPLLPHLRGTCMALQLGDCAAASAGYAHPWLHGVPAYT